MPGGGGKSHHDDCDVFRTLFGQSRKSSRRVDEKLLSHAGFRSQSAGGPGYAFFVRVGIPYVRAEVVQYVSTFVGHVSTSTLFGALRNAPIQTTGVESFVFCVFTDK